MPDEPSPSQMQALLETLHTTFLALCDEVDLPLHAGLDLLTQHLYGVLRCAVRLYAVTEVPYPEGLIFHTLDNLLHAFAHVPPGEDPLTPHVAYAQDLLVSDLERLEDLERLAQWEEDGPDLDAP